MKRLFLTLALALVAAPLFRAEPAVAAPSAAPLSSLAALQGPVDELIAQMNALYKLLGNDLTTDNLTADQMKQFTAIASRIEDLKDKYSSYKLTATDREMLVRWARTTNEKMSGEKMTAAEVAELRTELNGYATFGELTAELDPSDL